MKFVVRPTSVCVECVHFMNRDPGGERADIWYNHLCRANPLPEAIDPVTGKLGYALCNDLGRVCITDQQFAYCRECNDGNCEKFEARE